MKYRLPVWNVNTGTGDEDEVAGHITVNDPDDGALKYVRTMASAMPPLGDVPFFNPRASVSLTDFTVDIAGNNDFTLELVTDGCNLWFLLTHYDYVGTTEYETRFLERRALYE